MYARRLVLRTALGRLVVRQLHRPSEIPLAFPPDAAFLIAYPGERSLPSAVSDEHIVTSTVEWVRQMQADSELEVTAKTTESAGGLESPTNVLFVSYCDFT